MEALVPALIDHLKEFKGMAVTAAGVKTAKLSKLIDGFTFEGKGLQWWIEVSHTSLLLRFKYNAPLGAFTHYVEKYAYIANLEEYQTLGEWYTDKKPTYPRFEIEAMKAAFAEIEALEEKMKELRSPYYTLEGGSRGSIYFD